MGKLKKSLKELQEELRSRVFDKKDTEQFKGGINERSNPNRKDDWTGGCSDLVPQ